MRPSKRIVYFVGLPNSTSCLESFSFVQLCISSDVDAAAIAGSTVMALRANECPPHVAFRVVCEGRRVYIVVKSDPAGEWRGWSCSTLQHSGNARRTPAVPTSE